MNNYIKYFALVMILVFPLSCVTKLPPKVVKKPLPPPIVKKPLILRDGKKLEPEIVEKKEDIKPILPQIFEEDIEEAPPRAIIEEEKIEETEPQMVEEIVEPMEPQIFEEEIEEAELQIVEDEVAEVEPQIVEEEKQVETIEPEKETVLKLSKIMPSYFNEKDGSDMAFIPEGYFVMGDEDGEENEKPVGEIYVPGFYIDIYEITNKQYELFQGELYNSGSNFDCDLCPVTNVSWEEAESYCNWAEKRLPIEDEWEKAARGTQQLKWPWGNFPKENTTNGPGGQEKYLTGPEPVGSFPQRASVFGVLDMAGNVWEWTNSFYLPYYNKLSFDLRYQKEYKVLRGGSWKNITENTRTTIRHPVPPETRLPNIGFRCAKDTNQLLDNSTN